MPLANPAAGAPPGRSPPRTMIAATVVIHIARRENRRPAISTAVVGGVPPLTPCRRHPVEHDRHHHDRDAAVQRLADVERLRPSSTCRPSPAAPTKAAITTMPRAIMIVWLTPSMIDGLASGICTFDSVWRWCRPEGIGDLERGRRHVADAQRREPDRGRQGEDHGRDQGGRRSRCRRAARTEAGRSTRGSSASRRGTDGAPARRVGLPPRPDAERDADHQRDRHTATSTSESVSMLVLPHTEQPEGGEARGREQGQSPARRRMPAIRHAATVTARATSCARAPSDAVDQARSMPSSIGVRK